MRPNRKSQAHGEKYPALCLSGAREYQSRGKNLQEILQWGGCWDVLQYSESLLLAVLALFCCSFVIEGVCVSGQTSKTGNQLCRVGLAAFDVQCCRLMEART